MMIKTIKKYFKVWWLMSRNSFMNALNQRFGAAALIAGKIFRFFFFLLFLIGLMRGAKILSGYTENQVLFFYLTFYLVDTVSQFLYREVYRFRPLIISGDFDLVLIKPIKTLFRSLMGGADVLDLITLPPLILAVVIIGISLHPQPLGILLFLLLLINSLLIATAFHIFALSLAIVTTEIDHSMMIFRDLTSLGRFPVDIYKGSLKAVVTYVIPVGIMMTFPAKALMGLLNVWAIITSFVLGIILVVISLKVWDKALTKYSSASS
jgi:ABC-2 type transport system permease protein